MMSRRHPIISITGSSGAGTTSVKKTFENIFRREKVTAAYIEGDAFHRYNRLEMRTKMLEEAERGNKHFSHFSPETNLFEELEKAFRDYGTTPSQALSPIGARCRKTPISCSMRGCTAPSSPTGSISRSMPISRSASFP